MIATTSMPIAQALAWAFLAVMMASFFCTLLGAAVLVIRNYPRLTRGRAKTSKIFNH